MERGVTLSSDKGGLARVVSAPKEANTRYIRPILRRLLPFPSSFSSLRLFSLNPARGIFISVGDQLLSPRCFVVATVGGCCLIEKCKLMMERNCMKRIETIGRRSVE